MFNQNQARRRRPRQRTRLYFTLLIFAVGLLVGWQGVGRWLRPAGGPWGLSPAYQRVYVSLVAADYWRNQNVDQARAALAGWPDEALQELLAATVEQAPSPEVGQQVATLAAALALPQPQATLWDVLLEQKLFLVSLGLVALDFLGVLILVLSPWLRQLIPAAEPWDELAGLDSPLAQGQAAGRPASNGVGAANAGSPLAGMQPAADGSQPAEASANGSQQFQSTSAEGQPAPAEQMNAATTPQAPTQKVQATPDKPQTAPSEVPGESGRAGTTQVADQANSQPAQPGQQQQQPRPGQPSAPPPGQPVAPQSGQPQQPQQQQAPQQQPQPGAPPPGAPPQGQPEQQQPAAESSESAGQGAIKSLLEGVFDDEDEFAHLAALVKGLPEIRIEKLAHEVSVTNERLKKALASAKRKRQEVIA
ncbi:MAG: hypothetical protein AB1791_03100 [Chloroflexota bacterium]